MKSAIRSALTIAIAAALGMPSAHAQNAGDRTKVLQAAAYALGMARWSDIGTTTTRLPAIDIVNTMEFQGIGTNVGQLFSAALAGQMSAADALTQAQDATTRDMTRAGYIK